MPSFTTGSDVTEVYTKEEDLPRPAVDLLKKALMIVTGPRRAAYGSPTINFSSTAAMWNAAFASKLKEGESFSAADVGLAMILLKVARLSHDRTELRGDNYLDLAGYAACAYECMREDGEAPSAG